MRRQASPPRPAVLRLAGQDLELYCSTAAALILAGRLSRSYPDPERCAAFLAALAPSARGAHAAPVELDLRSGLPTLKEVVGVQADAKLAEGFLREAAARPADRPLTAAAQAKAVYYGKLRGLPVAALWTLEARLRRVDAKRGCAAFEVVYDRYDPAECVFVRHTILLEQQDALWGEGFLDRRGDYSAQTNAFRDKIERYTQDESELAFLLLGRVPGLRVEEVVRGRVGPLWSPWAPAPEEFRGAPEPAFTLHLPLDRASLSLAADRADDPFSTIYRRFLSDDARALVEEQQHSLGYRVHKDRKFVTTRGGRAALEERLARAGTRNIVYEV